MDVLVNILQSSKKKLFCGFIDLKGAFDSVWRDGLLYKIQQFNITGKCYQLIKSMYDGIKSCVSINGKSSNYFPSNIGVRQGENLSPFLFTIFLNDIENFLSGSNIHKGIELEDNVFVFLKLFVLLYADDTVILAETSTDLQNALDLYASYCKIWKLEINNSKTKVLVFSKGRLPMYNFTINDDRIEVVSEYKYLGVLFSRSGSFLTMKKHIAKQATKAMFHLLKKARALLLPIDIQLELFDKTIKPILLYGCEIWGVGDLRIIEQVQLKFLKFVLNIKKSTPNCIVYGETGVMPLKLDVQSRIIAFWSKLIQPETINLSTKLYSLAKSYYENRQTQLCFKWFDNIRDIFINCGCNGIWENQNFPNKIWLVKTIKQRLSDLFINEWRIQCDTNTSCTFYRMFKTNFGFETYLTSIPYKHRKFLLNFRTRNHRLPIETGRWKKIPRELRVCHLCRNETGDEFHLLLSCKHLCNLRKHYLPLYCHRNPNILKLQSLMNSKNTYEQRKLCIFIKSIFSTL